MALPGVMTKFRITELSGVDNPAQRGARATIMKRDDSGADPGHQPLNEGATMSSAIKKALGLAETATDAEVEAAVIKNAADSKAALETAEAEAALAKTKAAMTDKEKAFMDGKDDEAVKKFMAKSADERAAEIATYEKGDETVEIEGRTISKRAVGDDVFAVMKGQAARIAKQEADFKKAQEDAANATFTKAATVDYAHLAGSVEDRVLVLKAIAGADEATQKAAEAIFKAAEATAKLAFKKVGTSQPGEGGGEGGDDAHAKLTKMAEELVKSSTTPITFAKAYDQVATQNPDLYEEVLNPPTD